MTFFVHLQSLLFATMVTHRYGATLSHVAVTGLLCTLFALPMVCSAMPPSGKEEEGINHPQTIHTASRPQDKFQDVDEKSPTLEPNDQVSVATSARPLLHHLLSKLHHRRHHHERERDFHKRKKDSHKVLRKREKVFRKLVRHAIRKDPTLAALFLRYVFHDAYTVDAETGEGGCNGSIRQELSRRENTGLDRAVRILTPFQQKSGLSWGDVSAVAGAEAVEVAGGPEIKLKLGRSESNGEDPEGIIPSSRSNARTLVASFKSRGFSKIELAALSGAHSLGKGFGVPFVRNSNKFSNDYFDNLAWFIKRQKKGKSTAAGPPEKPNRQFPSDLALLEDNDLRSIVILFSKTKGYFFHRFKRAYVKLVNNGESF